MISYYYHPDYDKPDIEEKSCYDCRHNQTTGISWWCMNGFARKARMTSIPDTVECPFWAPLLPAEREWTFFGLFKGIVMAPGDNWILKIKNEKEKPCP